MRPAPSRFMEWQKARRPGPHTVSLNWSGVPAYPLEQLIRDPAELNPEHHPTDGYGLLELRGALAATYGVPFEEVYPTLGTSQANFMALAAAIEPGERVAMERPIYEPLQRAAEAAGARVEFFDRAPERGWRPDLDQVEALLKGGARVVVLTELHNPSGIALREEEVAAVEGLCERYGAWLMIDEVYRDFIHLDAPRSRRARGGRIVTTGSLTKVYGLGHLRAGWVFAPQELVGRMRVLADAMYAGAAVPTEVLALRALQHRGVLAAWVRELVEPARHVVERFMSHETRLRWTPPDGGVVCFPQLPEGIQGDAFVEHLIDKYDVCVAPGRFFGLPNGFRLGFPLATDPLRRGLSRISRALDELGV